MPEENKKDSSIIPIGSKGLVRVGNSLEIANKIIQEHEKRIISTKIKTTIIGNQEWTTQNLDVDCYSDGSPIPEITDPQEWSSIKTGAWCYLNNDPDNGKKFGKIYNSFVLYNTRNIIPPGFRLPNQDDLLILRENTLSNAWFPYTDSKIWPRSWDAFHLKSKDGWEINGDDRFNFNAKLGGVRLASGKFIISRTGFWTSSIFKTNGSIYITNIEPVMTSIEPVILSFPNHHYSGRNDLSIAKRETFERNGGCYIRCLKDTL